jgi:hypothetical protein
MKCDQKTHVQVIPGAMEILRLQQMFISRLTCMYKERVLQKLSSILLDFSNRRGSSVCL